MRLLTKILIILTMTILFADPPDWQDDPGTYQFTATIVGGIVLNIAGEQMGDEGDMFAAFDDDENVRGVGEMLFPPFGPYQDTPVFEVQLRSNDAGDILHFQYYDASEDAILEICQTYEFVINGILGNVEAPVEFNIGSFCMSFTNVSSTGIDINYESNTEIYGFQFSIDGVDVTNASGGEAENAGFMLTTGNNTIIGFSLSGASIPIGFGTLLSLEFEQLNGYNTLEFNNVVISGPAGTSIPISGPGSIDMPPDLFEFNQSISQAFYLFNLVLINGVEVESNDWVGAFNGDVCVGARQWDNSQCGGGVCELPVMGDDGYEYTAGYMQSGGIPAFKIYDASENLYYDATPSDEYPWFSNTFTPVVEILSAIVPGCTDSNDCNYNPLATEDNGSCDPSDDSCFGCIDEDYCNYDPSATKDDGSCDPSDDSCLGCMDEDACNFNANATIDNGSCYDAEENYDCAISCCTNDPDTGSAMDTSSICSNGAIIVDCAGECGGSAVDDACDSPVCSGGTTGLVANSSCTDCNDDINGTAYTDPNYGEDSCITNECVGGNTGFTACTQDCAGIWGGTLVNDICGICGGDNSTCEGIDCAGTPDGSAEEDDCDVCRALDDVNWNSTCTDCNGVVNGTAVTDPNFGEDSCITNECVGGNTDFTACTYDCLGYWGGSAALDECGVCDGIDNYVFGTCNDCAGISNGTAYLDGCSNCVGGNTGEIECTTDCAEVFEGTSFYDNCDVCVSVGDTSCIKGCDGYWKNDGSQLVLDQCEVCGGNNSTCTDCNSVVNGTAVTDPNFGEDSCITNECVGGNTGFTACTKDCAGIWGGSALEDNCGVCNSDSSNDCNYDCAGTLDGSAEEDDCGVCAGDNSTCLDCAGVPNGEAVYDNCGVCNSDSSNDCIKDCAGNWGGTAVYDECGICEGDCFGDPGEECDDGLTDCSGNCVDEIDCEGNCGGPYTPSFPCLNTPCVVCNPADCIDLDSDCNSMDISPYLLPDEFGISKIFPNPFNPVTHIQYELTQFGLIAIKIYDIQGRVVDQLMNEYQSPGHYSLNWNAGNHASGMYIVEIVTQLENNEVSRDLQKILYLK